MTLAELSTLVVGCALAFSLPRLYPPSLTISFNNVPAPRWIVDLYFASEFVMKIDLAMVPVILARCARYGGLCRPAECLVLLCSLSLSNRHLEVIHRMRQFSHRVVLFRSNSVIFVPGSGLWRWKLGAQLAFPAAVITFISLRKKLPGWAATVLLSVAALAWLGGASDLFDRGASWMAEQLTARLGPSDYVWTARDALASLPTCLLFGVPGIAALFEHRRRARPGWTWVEWVGASTAEMLLLKALVTDVFADLVAFSAVPPLLRARACLVDHKRIL